MQGVTPPSPPTSWRPRVPPLQLTLACVRGAACAPTLHHDAPGHRGDSATPLATTPACSMQSCTCMPSTRDRPLRPTSLVADMQMDDVTHRRESEGQVQPCRCAHRRGDTPRSGADHCAVFENAPDELHRPAVGRPDGFFGCRVDQSITENTDDRPSPPPLPPPSGRRSERPTLVFPLCGTPCSPLSPCLPRAA